MIKLLWKVRQFLKKIKHRTTVLPLLHKILERIETRDSNRYLYTHVHSSTVQNSQKVETTKCPWMDEQKVAYPHNGILFSHEKGTADTCYNVNLEDIMLSDVS